VTENGDGIVFESVGEIARLCLTTARGDYDRAVAMAREIVIGEDAQEAVIHVMGAVWWTMTAPEDTTRQ